MFKVIDAMVSFQQKAEQVAYKPKDVSKVLYEQWKEEIPIREGSVSWASFKRTFVDKFFPFELRDSKM